VNPWFAQVITLDRNLLILLAGFLSNLVPEARSFDVKTEAKLLIIIILVGERGFEPPTPWSRTRCSTRLSHSPNLRLEGRLRAERLLADAFVNARELKQSVSEDRAKPARARSPI
jgi:hypothetical protein